MLKRSVDKSPSVGSPSEDNDIVSISECREPNLDVLIYSTAGLKLNDMEVYNKNPTEDAEITGLAINLNNPVHIQDEIEKEHLFYVEFLFSIYNLPLCKYLKRLIKKSSDGFVSLEKIYSFEKVQRFEPWKKDITNVLKSSKLLEVDENGLKVRRINPIKNMLEHLPNTYCCRSLFFSSFDSDQDLQSLEYNFIQMLLNFAKDKMRININGESGDCVVGRVIPLFLLKEGVKVFKGSVQVVFLSREIAHGFLEFLNDGFYFDGKQLKVQNRITFGIENYMSCMKLVRIQGYHANILKSSLTQFLKELSSDFHKIKFFQTFQGSAPFAIIQLKSNPSGFINKVNTTLFDANKYPQKTNPGYSLSKNHPSVFTVPLPFILNASPVTESEFPGAKAFLLEIASRPKRKREK